MPSPTRPTSSQSEVVQDIRALLRRATPAVIAAWAAEDKKKKKKGGVNKGFVDALKKDLDRLDASTELQATRAIARRAAQLRKKLARSAPARPKSTKKGRAKTSLSSTRRRKGITKRAPKAPAPAK